MKKTTLLALCLGFVLASSNSSAEIPKVLIADIVLPGDGRQVIKHEELPEAIKKILATDAYKGWNLKEAALITPAPAQTPAPAASPAPATSAASTTSAVSTTSVAPTGTAAAKPAAAPQPAAAPTQNAGPYYELTLTKDKETKIVKFQKDGSLAK
ncbi:MAG: hypothetical protein JNL60_13315 [Bacteroidia bacterium]|nr:hypothetical protein [Bacteroidia bacterium]